MDAQSWAQLAAAQIWCLFPTLDSYHPGSVLLPVGSYKACQVLDRGGGAGSHADLMSEDVMMALRWPKAEFKLRIVAQDKSNLKLSASGPGRSHLHVR